MEVKRLAKHSLVYSASSILAQAVVLLMVPVFTKNMNQDQFGQYNLLISVQSLLAILITLGSYSGMSRFINEFEDKNRTKNIVLTFSLIWGSFMCLVSFFYGDFLYQLVFPMVNSEGYFINFLVFSSVLLCLISIYNSYFTMLFKPKLVSIINLARVVFMLLFSTYFIMVRKDGLYGALLAQMLAYLVVLAGVVVYDLKNLRIAFDWGQLKVILKYGLGLVPGNASTWVYTLIDRYFIQAMLGLQQVAIYSMGYRIGMMMEPILISPFKSVFTSFKYKVYKEPDAPDKFRQIYGYYNFIGWFCVLGFSVFAKPAVALLSTAEYGEAFKIVPLIAVSYYLYGLGEFYSVGIHIRNKSILHSLILGIGAGSNILLNFGLIPRYGILGAALATILSYLIINVLYFIIGKRYLDLGLRYFEPCKGGAVFLGLYGIYFLTYRFINHLLAELLLASLLCLVFIVFGFIIHLVPRQEVKTAVRQLAQRFGLTKFT